MLPTRRPSLVPWIVVAVIVLVAAITNPDPDVHNAKVVDAIYSDAGVDEDSHMALLSGDMYEQAGAVLGYSLGISAAQKMLDRMVTVDNYVLFSITNFRFEGKKTTIGIGVFGNVCLFCKPGG